MLVLQLQEARERSERGTHLASERESMKIASNRIGPVDIIAPQSALVEESIEALQQEMQRHFRQSDTKILIDLSKVPYIDSKGLEFLLDSVEDLHKKGGQMKLCKASPLCNDIFLATRMSSFFEIYAEVEDAVRSYL
jgi:anti-sigma B factor antagonist